MGDFGGESEGKDVNGSCREFCNVRGRQEGTGRGKGRRGGGRRNERMFREKERKRRPWRKEGKGKEGRSVMPVGRGLRGRRKVSEGSKYKDDDCENRASRKSWLVLGTRIDWGRKENEDERRVK